VFTQDRSKAGQARHWTFTVKYHGNRSS